MRFNMTIGKTAPALLLGVLTVLYASGVCNAASPASAPGRQPSSSLQRVEGARLGVVYSVPKQRLKAYSSILIERIGIEYQTGKPGMYQLSKSDLNRLHFLSMSIFEKHLTKDGRYRLVNTRRPGTLVLRAKLTDVWWPFRESDAYGRTKAKDRYALRMMLKAELIDAVTGETLVVASDRKGRPLYEVPTVLTSRDGWREMEKYLNFWAGSLRRALDEARR